MSGGANHDDFAGWLARLRLPLFVLLAVVQLAVPAAMIAGRERVLATGEVFRFRTAPVDPYDAFRGRYVALGFPDAEAVLPAGQKPPRRGERVYVELERDDEGFARLGTFRRERPEAGPYLRLRVLWTADDRVSLELPFDRYYLEEPLAPEAERLYREHSGGGDRRTAWVAVRVLDGRAAIEELYVGGVPIRDFVREQTGGPSS